MTDPKPNLRALIQDHKVKAPGRSEVRIPWTVDGDLEDKLNELEDRRIELEIELAATPDDGRAGTAPKDRKITAELEQVKKDIAATRKAGEDATVSLVFKPLRPSDVDKLLGQYLNDDGTITDEQLAARNTALADACFRGVQFGNSAELDKSMTWAEIRDAVDEDNTPLMNSGMSDSIENRVFAANKAVNDTPFSFKPSAKTR